MTEIETRTLDEQHTAVVFDPDDVAEALASVHAYLQRWGAGPAGEPFVRDLGGEVEVGYPATTPVGGEGDVEPSELPAGDVAVTRTTADGVDAARAALEAWVAEQGKAPAGDAWEVLVGDDPAGDRDVVLPFG